MDYISISLYFGIMLSLTYFYFVLWDFNYVCYAWIWTKCGFYVLL